MLSRRKRAAASTGAEGGGPQITVEVVPARGEGRNVPVNLSSGSLAHVLKAAGVTRNKMAVTINGEPSDDDRFHVPPGAKVVLTEKARGS